MRAYFLSATVAVSLLAVFPGLIRAETNISPFVYESPFEFFGAGDFDGDGRADVVVVDKESGKYRLGYQLTDGNLSWVDCRPSGIKGISGFGLGSLFVKNHDGLAFTSPDANQVTLVDASSSSAPGKPQTIPFTAALGPNTVLPVTAGTAGKSGLLDIYVGSIYNSPDANLATVLRNDGSEYPKMVESTLPGPATHANRITLKAGQPEADCELVTDDKGVTFRAENFSTGKPETLLTLPGLPTGSDYASGNFRGSALSELLFYKPGENTLTVRPVEEAGQASFNSAKGIVLTWDNQSGGWSLSPGSRVSICW